MRGAGLCAVWTRPSGASQCLSTRRSHAIGTPVGDVLRMDRYLTKTELADYLQMSPRWIELRCSDRKNPMPHRKLGRNVRFRLDEIEPWLEGMQ